MKMIKARPQEKVNFSLIIEEFIYLLRNEDFQKHIHALRRKYNIPKEGIDKKVSPWISRNWTGQQINGFKKDMEQLFSQCFYRKSRKKGVFEATIERYVLKNKPVITSQTTLIDNNVELEMKADNNTVVLTLRLGFDTTKDDVKQTILERWEWIEYLQARLTTRNVGESKKELRKLKLQFWEMYKQGKDISEIADSEINTKHYLPNEIKGMIERTDERIKSSFSQEIEM